ncbi:hypothetical protein NM688_g4255 [Phlebia brevispora]|uniref:Uncharacterized protein n=1 Tax=Phlebia brevispora TaxID=194682 RepID=A0ACC1T3F0_9APHY|nr:hypothetical protein NM688_g4255 [Phlebia brevispora]
MPSFVHTPLVLVAWLLTAGLSVLADDSGDTSAFNNVVLNAPPVPNPLPPTEFTLKLEQNSQNVPGLSIPQNGSFLGFSLEMSVVNQVVGSSPQILQVPFLNLMSIITERVGQVNVRVGGNTQDYAVYVDSLPGGQMVSKDTSSSTNPTETPTLYYTSDFVYLFANVSSLVNVKWYLGVPMNDTSHLRLQMAELGESILGDHLLGLQVGNEPDLYASHGHRPASYNPANYNEEFGIVVDAINSDQNIPIHGNLVAPSIIGTQKGWTAEEVWDTGFVDQYSSSLGALAVERYPDNNCANTYQNAGFGEGKSSQDVFPNYLNHTSGVHLVQDYLSSTAFAQQKGKPFVMMETNTASCGGFPGVSDSFGAALWAIDYALQMAYGNFSGAHLHIGGMDVSYNPFTPPMTNESTSRQWTIGPVYYSVVAVAETLGRSGKSQVVDLQANGGNIFTPGYAIYDNGNLDKVALLNYMTDPTGAASYITSVSIPGGSTPATVTVKYLLADSVAEKFNITWAGQTLGGQYESDGRFQGDESVVTVQCNQAAGTCPIRVPAPGFALVFLNNDALAASEPQTTATFSTTTFTAKGAHGSSPTFSASSGGSGSSTPGAKPTSGSGSAVETSGASDLLPATCITVFAVLVSTLGALRLL